MEAKVEEQHVVIGRPMLVRAPTETSSTLLPAQV
eukprot:CAMPEP_0206450828 /NCGR_PEP_ID=MMETSP0324_2-20121206/18968_1 /ASSEMBLY_ACC=CAM_ASM_000836 /TAXON_ID=2866 /ORGANISM="Crypthecodinium cohnii, Strain Seligo" /LENGTH=33 /DNA_ID= /DNA_START= /DNA_END= /DNA_ORIENTATION=